MKIACPSKGDIEAMKLLGASPVAMKGAENYESLMRGVVDGVISNIGGFYSHKMYEPGDYITICPLGAATVATMASEEGLKKLSSVDQAIVLFVSDRRNIDEAYDLVTSESRRLKFCTIPNRKTPTQVLVQRTLHSQIAARWGNLWQTWKWLTYWETSSRGDFESSLICCASIRAGSSRLSKSCAARRRKRR